MTSSTGSASSRTFDVALGFQYVGAHYSSCPVEIRELWTQAFDSPDGRRRLAAVVQSVVGEKNLALVPVFTCNRFDLYLGARLGELELVRVFAALCREAAQILAARSEAAATSPGQGGRAQHSPRGFAMPEASLNELHALATDTGGRLGSLLRIFHGQDALRHLFRVASSLDSLVLGEPHVLGQLKEELARARELGLASPFLETLFGQAFGVAKRVRTETELGRNAVSIGHASVTLAARIFEDLGRHSVLVIGAGEMARLAAQHVATRGVHKLTIANRTVEHASALIGQIGQGQATGLVDALGRIHHFDVIIVATASRGLIVEEHHVRDISRLRRGQASVLIDISVPRNVSPRCANVSPDLFVFDIDDLEKVMDSNRERRRDAAVRAERLIDEVLRNFVRKSHERDQVQLAAHLHRFVCATVRGELAKTLGSGREQEPVLSSEQIDVVARAVAKKLVSGPAAALRQGDVPESVVMASIVRLFPALAEDRESETAAPPASDPFGP